ncbi:MAG: sigma-70 family RNA polymerase sigma factor [Rubrivivax sp.]|nr:sigma-70 family RNA polymerase sigma factor [Rubrivivax sp.]
MAPTVSDTGRTESELIVLAKGGDQSAYGVLVRRHQDRIYRHLLNLTGSREEALELAQEVFIKAWQALPTWRPDAQFHTWVYRIASNAALDILRRRKVVRFVPLEDDYDAPVDQPGPEAQLQARQSLRRLDASLARLSLEQREIVLLREVEGLSYDELATTLGIDVGTVKSRLARARAALAALFDGTGK